MKNKLVIFGLAVLLVLLVGSVIVSAQSAYSRSTSSSFRQGQDYQADFRRLYSSSNIDTYWPILNDPKSCFAREDILLQVSPLGCEPAVVRSDLLAEQNVPVFCQIDALELNPLIDVEQIRNIRFRGEYPPEVAGVAFHPARAALRSRDTLLGSPLIDNIGYVVVVLRQNPHEDELPDIVQFNLSAQLDYYAGNAFGVGAAEFKLNLQSDDEWERDKIEQSFWKGRYFVRLDEANSNFATISIYQGDVKVSTQKVERGKVSQEIFVPGFYCQAGLQIAYDRLQAREDSARLEIDGDVVDVYDGTKFLNNKCRVNDVRAEVNGSGAGKVDIACGGERFSLSLNKEDNKLIEDKQLSDAEADLYFEQAMDDFRSVLEDYPLEKESSCKECSSYAENALEAAIDLANHEKITEHKQKTKEDLLRLLIDNYPNSDSILKYKEELKSLNEFDISGSAKLVNLDNGLKNIRVVSFKDGPERGKTNVSLTVEEGERLEISVNQDKPLKDAGGNMRGMIRLTEAGVDEVVLEPRCSENSNGKESLVKGNDIVIRERQTETICGVRVRLEKALDADDTVASIRILPKVRGASSETSFSVGVGIEKRAIELSPDKTKKKIDNLQESIEKWEGVSDSLGEVVTGLKTACFATAGALTIKNFFEGIDGTALARQHAMRGDNGWNKRCGDLVADGEYGSLTECFNKNRGEINRDVAARAAAIDKINNEIKVIEEIPGVTSDEFGGESIDTDKFKEEYYKKLKLKYKDDSDAKALLEKYEKYKGEDFTAYKISDLRELDYNLELRDGDARQEAIKDSLEDVDRRITDSWEGYNEYLGGKAEGKYSTNYGSGGDSSGRSVARTPVRKIEVIDGNAKIDRKTLDVGKVSLEGINGAAFIQGDSKVEEGDKSNEKEVYLVLGNKRGDRLHPSAVYHVNEVGDTIEITGEVKRYEGKVSNFLATNKILSIEDVGALYSNQISPQDRKVLYFSSGPDREKAALVPFDVQNGWYAKVRSNLDIGREIGAYDTSGLPRSWRICNVGPDGVIDSDDKCQGVNEGISSDTLVLGLGPAQSRNLIRDSRKALIDANAQARRSTVEINGESFLTGLASNYESAQCQDFMSPTDCQILFNVCDPVICPNTRCDFGGQYPVADVIQTGVVGSALLCLPNIEEGIALPVCLTGIQAGIDGYASVLKAHQQCLIDSLESGEVVGICDEISSVYACSFFWEQLAPVAKELLPLAIEKLTGRDTPRGGGEYLTVRSAWENTQKSVDFFTQSYAVNSLEAFNLRNVEEAGTDFCKAFISAKAPTAFEGLVEPDSPPQFHATFSETPFSSVTVPPTAQYKVFYHIFAGHDRGISFRVYLRDPPQSPFYSTAPTIIVDSGFIPRGEFASETIDFTSPEGYKQLCVRINNDEHCGFGQVSTSFAVNSLRDLYVKDQATDSNIQSEVECVSGRASVGALFTNVNPQVGFEEAGLPEIYNRGITRICSNVNPGLSVDPGRFVDVGHCGNNNVRCWLDSNSVSDAITDNNKGLRNSTLSEIEKTQKQTFEDKGLVDSDSSADFNISRIDREVREKKGNKEKLEGLVGEIDELFVMLYWNHHKARLLFIRGVTNSNIVRAIIGSSETIRPAPVVDPVPVTGDDSADGGTPVSGEYGLQLVRDDWFFTEGGKPLSFWLDLDDNNIKTSVGDIGRYDPGKREVRMIPDLYGRLRLSDDVIKDIRALDKAIVLFNIDGTAQLQTLNVGDAEEPEP